MERHGKDSRIKTHDSRLTTHDSPLTTSTPVTNIDEVSGDGGGGGHGRTDQMRAAALSLTPLEVAVGGAGAALPRLEDVWIHPQTHAATRLSPFEAGRGEDLVQAFLLGGHLHLVRAGHHHR